MYANHSSTDAPSSGLIAREIRFRERGQLVISPITGDIQFAPHGGGEYQYEDYGHADGQNVRFLDKARFRGQSLTVGSDLDSRLAFGGSLGRADWRYGRRVGSDRAAVAA